MVDFRYHLVSIIAVFLALAVGIVLGTTTINGPLLDKLNNGVSSLTKDRDTVRSANDQLNKRVSNQTKFAKSVLPFVVTGRLAHEQVVVVTAPDASGDARDGTMRALVAAGATIAGRVALTKKFLDPAQADTLALVGSQAVNGAPPGEGTPLQRAANQLSIALATPTRSRDASAGFNAETERVLSLFKEAGLVTVDGPMPARTSVVVVVAPGPANAVVPGNGDQIRAVNEVIGALARQAAAVVAVTASGGAAEGGVLSSLLRDQRLATDVSSVDDADTAAGQVAVVLAVVERLRAAPVPHTQRPAAGHYGEGPGAQKPLPDLVDIS